MPDNKLGLGTSVAITAIIAGAAGYAGGFAKVERVYARLTSDVAAAAKNATDQIDARKTEVIEAISAYEQLPVGSIIAWYKNPAATPDGKNPGPELDLPDGWLECDGIKPIPPDSRLYELGLTHTPNLNGEARFLRGAVTSGEEQDHAFQGHSHKFNHEKGLAALEWNQPPSNGYRADVGGHKGAHEWRNNWQVTEPSALTGYGSPQFDQETRPINMSVVWIMRVK